MAGAVPWMRCSWFLLSCIAATPRRSGSTSQTLLQLQKSKPPRLSMAVPGTADSTSQERTRCRTEILEGVGRRQPGARHPRRCSPNLAVQLAALQLTNLLALLRSMVFPWGSVESVPLPSSGWSRLGWNPGTSPWPPVPLSLPPGLRIRETVDKARAGTQANTSMQ